MTIGSIRFLRILGETSRWENCCCLPLFSRTQTTLTFTLMADMTIDALSTVFRRQIAQLMQFLGKENGIA